MSETRAIIMDQNGNLVAVTSNALAAYLAAALPAGTNTIGKLGANSGVDIGDVTVNNTAASPVYTQSGYTIKTTTIANGASLSGEVDLEGYSLVGIIMPAAWTAADLTFQAATTTEGTFCDVYDNSGVEVSTDADASRAIGTDGVALALAPFRFVKLRSGTTGTPVNQGAERTISLVLKA